MLLHELFLIESHWFEREPIVVFKSSTVVFHTTDAETVSEILRDGFKTGKELGKHERRGAVFFADPDVNAGLYARNDRADEPNYGKEGASIGINISGLRLLNMSFKVDGQFVNHKKYKDYVIRGELEAIDLFAQKKIDGAVSFLKDGRIYEVCLPKDIATSRIIAAPSIN